MQGADSARESLPRVGGGAERSEAEGLLETKESVIKLSSWRVFCHTENCSNYKNCHEILPWQQTWFFRQTKTVACIKKVKSRCRGQNIWRDISVVRFLPLSFYAKKKVAERKARIRGIAPRYATLLFGAVSPLYIPLMTAQPIATVLVYTRNGRQALSLPFLKY